MIRYYFLCGLAICAGAEILANGDFETFSGIVLLVGGLWAGVAVVVDEVR